MTATAQLSAEGVLIFLDRNSEQAYSAAVDSDGSFAVDEDVQVGTYTVYLAPKLPAADDAEQPMAIQIDISVPYKFWNESTSNLNFTANEGDNSPATVIFEKNW